MYQPSANQRVVGNCQINHCQSQYRIYYYSQRFGKLRCLLCAIPNGSRRTISASAFVDGIATNSQIGCRYARIFVKEAANVSTLYHGSLRHIHCSCCIILPAFEALRKNAPLGCISRISRRRIVQKQPPNRTKTSTSMQSSKKQIKLCTIVGSRPGSAACLLGTCHRPDIKPRKHAVRHKNSRASLQIVMLSVFTRLPGVRQQYAWMSLSVSPAVSMHFSGPQLRSACSFGTSICS